MREATDAGERRAIADVHKYGWHVLKVLEDDEGPGFAYTVGLYHSFRHPELMIVGLPLDVAHAILNLAGEAIRRGAQYSVDVETEDLLEERTCRFRRVPESEYQNYLGWDLWFYDGPAFPALQVIWPDRAGRWPWDPLVDPSIRNIQPVIGAEADPPEALP